MQAVLVSEQAAREEGRAAVASEEEEEEDREGVYIEVKRERDLTNTSPGFSPVRGPAG